MSPDGTAAGKPLPAAAGDPYEPRHLVRVRVWDHLVRATHWSIVLSTVLLSVTGFMIGRPLIDVSGEAGQHFVMGTVRTVHFYAAIVFTLAVLSRITWLFASKGHSSWRELIPVARERRAGIGPMLAFYLFARPRPIPVVGHNPLAALVYSIIFCLYLVMITTGLGMYAVDATTSPVSWAAGFLTVFGGAESARWIHHVTMWLLLGFAVHHVYSAMLTSSVEKNGTMESIFTGNKWVPRDLLAEEARAEAEAKAKKEGRHVRTRGAGG